MSKWTHTICKSCWNKREPERDAVKVLYAESEKCCFCDVLTSDGIYIREDPKDIMCTGTNGIHALESPA